MPPPKGHIYDHIPGHPVGTCYKTRQELAAAGVHGSPRQGIFAKGTRAAYAVVLSGQYEDDNDQGLTFTYTGAGGRLDKDGKQSKVQQNDQRWKGANYLLRLSHQERRKVRVIRGHKSNSPYAPKEGYRYDGLYFVIDIRTGRGKQGHKVCLFDFKRCKDQAAPPWTYNPSAITAEAGPSERYTSHEAGSFQAQKLALHRKSDTRSIERAQSTSRTATSSHRPTNADEEEEESIFRFGSQSEPKPFRFDLAQSAPKKLPEKARVYPSRSYHMRADQASTSKPTPESALPLPEPESFQNQVVARSWNSTPRPVETDQFSDSRRLPNFMEEEEEEDEFIMSRYGARYLREVSRNARKSRGYDELAGAQPSTSTFNHITTSDEQLPQTTTLSDTDSRNSPVMMAAMSVSFAHSIGPGPDPEASFVGEDDFLDGYHTPVEESDEEEEEEEEEEEGADREELPVDTRREFAYCAFVVEEVGYGDGEEGEEEEEEEEEDEDNQETHDEPVEGAQNDEDEEEEETEEAEEEEEEDNSQYDEFSRWKRFWYCRCGKVHYSAEEPECGESVESPDVEMDEDEVEVEVEGEDEDEDDDEHEGEFAYCAFVEKAGDGDGEENFEEEEEEDEDADEDADADEENHEDEEANLRGCTESHDSLQEYYNSDSEEDEDEDEEGGFVLDWKEWKHQESPDEGEGEECPGEKARDEEKDDEEDNDGDEDEEDEGEDDEEEEDEGEEDLKEQDEDEGEEDNHGESDEDSNSLDLDERIRRLNV